MNKEELKRLKKKITELNKNPQGKIYSKEERIWQNLKAQCQELINKGEEGILVNKAVMEMADKKIKEIEEDESKL
jgi:hypothetical protein